MDRIHKIVLIYLCLPALLGVLLAGCSTKKDTIRHRTYHNVTSKYNGYFHAKLRVKEGMDQIVNGYEEDYTQLLPIFIYSDESSSKTIYPQMDEAIKKCSKVIEYHSMEIKGRERCNWIDNSWFVIGQANFHKREFGMAKQTFDYITRHYKEQDARYPAMLWLVRTYIEQENYEGAKRMLNLAGTDAEFPKELLEDYHAVYADYYIRQGEYESAAEELELSIRYTSKRKVKTRRYFILAQLYHKTGELNRSSGLYALIIKRNPTYEMAFYAKINRALAFDANSGNSAEIRELLDKMLNDDKNIEFKDQIYYALAELDLKEGKEEEGIENLKNATKYSVSNDNVKGLAFLKLADIYFEKPEYEIAQAYYDSTVTFINQNHPDYEEILGKSNSLTRLVRDLNTVSEQDSLQKLAGMSEKEIDKIVYAAIDRYEAAEAERQQKEQNQQLISQQAKQNQNSQFSRNVKSGDWYFYNPGAIGLGASEFSKIWGRRKNEDNWRRSDKSSTIASLLDEEEEFVAPEDTVPEARDPKNKLYYTKHIPLTEEKMARSHNLIIEALYDLGLVYKEEMNDEPKSIEAFEELLSRYDTSKYEINCYYQLYLMYQDQGDIAKANYYKDRILVRFPDTDYARVIRDPDYLKNKKEEASEVLAFYKQTYEYFRKGFYSVTLENCEKADALYPGNDLKPKFDFLKAICSGKEGGEPQLIAGLNSVVQNHPSTDVAKQASQMLYVLQNKDEFKAEETEEEEEEEESFDPNKYKFNMGDNHSFVILVPADKEDLNTVKTMVSDFNRRFFSTKGLKVSSVLLGKEYHMISVKRFSTSIDGMKYYDTFKENETILKDLNTKNYPLFTISYANFATFYQDKNIDHYLQFFSENYLSKE